MLYEANMGNSKAKVMRVFKATGLRYRINIVSGGKGVYILSGVKEKRQESEISIIVWVFQLLLAGIVAETNVSENIIPESNTLEKFNHKLLAEIRPNKKSVFEIRDLSGVRCLTKLRV